MPRTPEVADGVFYFPVKSLNFQTLSNKPVENDVKSLQIPLLGAPEEPHTPKRMLRISDLDQRGGSQVPDAPRRGRGVKNQQISVLKITFFSTNFFVGEKKVVRMGMRAPADFGPALGWAWATLGPSLHVSAELEFGPRLGPA